MGSFFQKAYFIAHSATAITMGDTATSKRSFTLAHKLIMAAPYHTIMVIPTIL
jgi:hypothetical protein